MLRDSAILYLNTLRKQTKPGPALDLLCERIVGTLLSSRLELKARTLITGVLIDLLRADKPRREQVKAYFEKELLACNPSLGLAYVFSALSKLEKHQRSWALRVAEWCLAVIPQQPDQESKAELGAEFLHGLRGLIKVVDQKEGLDKVVIGLLALFPEANSVMEQGLSCLKLLAPSIDQCSWEGLVRNFREVLPQLQSKELLVKTLEVLVELLKSCKNFEVLLQSSQSFIKFALSILSTVSISSSSINFVRDIVDRTSEESEVEVEASNLLYFSAKAVPSHLHQLLVKAVEGAASKDENGARSLMILCVFKDSVLERQDYWPLIVKLFEGPVFESLVNCGSEAYNILAMLFVEKYFGLLLKEGVGQSALLLSLFEQILKNFGSDKNEYLKEDEFECCYKIVGESYFGKTLGKPEAVRALKWLFEGLRHPYDESIIMVLDLFEELFVEDSSLILALVQRLVDLVLAELRREARQDHNINRCWNVLRHVADKPVLVQAAGERLEQSVLPLYEFMSNPMNIEFDEDICLFVSAIIKASQRVSAEQLKLFELFPLIFKKYKNCFCFAFTCLAQICRFGAQVLASAPKAINMVLAMVKENLQTNQENEYFEALFILVTLLLNVSAALEEKTLIAIRAIVSSKLSKSADCGIETRSCLIACLHALSICGNLSPGSRQELLDYLLRTENLKLVSLLEMPRKVACSCLSLHIRNATEQSYLKRLIQASLHMYRKLGTEEKENDPDLFSQYKLTYDLFNMYCGLPADEKLLLKERLEEWMARTPDFKEWLTKNLPPTYLDTVKAVLSTRSYSHGSRRIVEVRK